MGSNNFLSILKTITEIMKCPSCEHTYDLEEVQFLSQMDGFCLVHMTCSHCKTPVWVNFFATNKKPNYKIAINTRENDLYDMEEISSDELISFHKMINKFDGNFKKAFGR